MTPRATWCSVAVLVLVLVLVGPARAEAPVTDPAEAQMLFEQAQALAKDKKLTEAISALRKAVELAPRNDKYLAVLSDLEREAGNFTDGLEHARRAIAINDKVAVYYILATANAYLNQDLAQAREYCQKALQLSSGDTAQGSHHDAKLLEGFLVKRTYTITWTLDPSKGKLTGDTLSIALPRGDLPYQRVAYEVTGARSHRVVKSEANDLLQVVPQGNKPITLVTRITVQPYSYKKELLSQTRTAPPREARAYLGQSDGIDPTSPKLSRIATGLKGGDNVTTVKNIMAWMQKNISYKNETSSIWKLDFKNADDILGRGHAECRGFTILFVALCRAAGVPARPVWGLAMLPPTPASPGAAYSSHNFAEVYIPGSGWVPVDPQKPETLGWLPTNVLRIFMDVRRNASSLDNLPLINLLAMNGAKVKVEETRTPLPLARSAP
jgi:tetratricopeptide (TPR) repeat protein